MAAYVISGATGHVGSVVANDLLDQREQVIGVVRDAGKGSALRDRGAELSVGSLDDPAFLTRALAGASGFFAMLPPAVPDEDFYAGQRRFADAIAAAVKNSAVPNVVLLSSLGAELPDGTGPIKGLHYFENALRATGTRLIAIRAAYFQENIAGVIPAARQFGVYPSFLPSPDAAIPMIATRDIGHLAAELLKSPPGSSEVVDLVGPEYSARQLSERLGAAIGKQPQLVTIRPEDRISVLTQAGVPRHLAEVYAEMYAALSAGMIVPKDGRLVIGTTTIDEVLPMVLNQ